MQYSYYTAQLLHYLLYVIQYSYYTVQLLYSTAIRSLSDILRAVAALQSAVMFKLNGRWLKLKRAKTKTGSGCP